MSSNGLSSISVKDDKSHISHKESSIANFLKSRVKRKTIRPSIQDEIEKRKEDFKSYLMANMTNFPINARCNIIGYNGMPIKHSNIDKSIDRLIDPRMENMPSPAGTQLLSNRAMKDPYLNKLIRARFNTPVPRTDIDSPAFVTPSPKILRNDNELLNPLEPITPYNKRRSFLNKRLQNSQKGTGKNSFKPSLWR